METLVKSIAEFFAAILGMIGFVGKPRRRASIRDDLQLLTELTEHPDFGAGSWPHQALMNRVALDVARLAGVPLNQRRIQWSSVILALLVGLPLGYWTFNLNQDGFQWYSLFPGIIAGLMAIALLGMFLPSSEDSPPEEEESSSSDLLVRPLAGDINAATGEQGSVIRSSITNQTDP
ncbi:MAG: hypothetical protein WAQ33_12465 [Gaiellaceae bacterium]